MHTCQEDDDAKQRKGDQAVDAQSGAARGIMTHRRHVTMHTHALQHCMQPTMAVLLQQSVCTSHVATGQPEVEPFRNELQSTDAM